MLLPYISTHPTFTHLKFLTHANMTQTLETHFNLYQFENPRLGKRDTDGTQGYGVGKKCQMVLIGRRI